ncbi:hypothetical protein [Halolamina salifodinae]|uniref:Uncharacterized protein n=1 Tax=Halolamina salifodinae TaxID=1202767 RepID=A0A8T4GX46_9EURY|nr:hypothetical protein [Halolamina salifodinae]MBP1986633.1 hypothetical protein [Halolamina salifodinae]
MTGFDDLNEAGKDQAADEEEPADVEADETLEEDASTSTDAGGPNEPSFPFDESVQAQIYPRRSTTRRSRTSSIST